MTSKWCRDVNFAGKKFTSMNDVTPVWVYNDKGERVFYEASGTARVSLLYSITLVRQAECALPAPRGQVPRRRLRLVRPGSRVRGCSLTLDCVF